MGGEDAAFEGVARAHANRVARTHEDTPPNHPGSGAIACARLVPAFPDRERSYTEWERLHGAFDRLEPNARAVALEVVERLVGGKDAGYPDFDDDRDWPTESTLESADGTNYAAMIKVSGHGSNASLALLYQHLASLFLARAIRDSERKSQAAE